MCGNAPAPTDSASGAGCHQVEMPAERLPRRRVVVTLAVAWPSLARVFADQLVLCILFLPYYKEVNDYTALQRYCLFCRIADAPMVTTPPLTEIATSAVSRVRVPAATIFKVVPLAAPLNHS